MGNQHLSIVFAVKGNANEAFDSINNVAAWWTKNLDGESSGLNDEFVVEFGDVHFSRQKIVECIPGKKVVWLVTESRLNFVADKQEWTGTRIIFEVFEEQGQTMIRFTHEGLVPEVECYDACSNAWAQYMNSLQQLIDTGKGEPAARS
jgi:Activator of Hsp90 ATPase homolog 1-like protein